MGNFNDKSALIWGCSPDVRVEIITRLTAKGAYVFAGATRRDAQPNLQVSNARKGDTGIEIDLSNPDLDRLFYAVSCPLDILILGGAERVPSVTLEDLTLQQSEAIFRTNVEGPISIIQRALDCLSDRASFVMVSSNATPDMLSHNVACAAANAFLRSYARMLCREVKKRGIRVNTVGLGPVGKISENRTLNAEVNGALLEIPATMVPAERLDSSATVARAMVSLFCDERSTLTGTGLTIEDGLMQITPLPDGGRA